MYTSLIYHYLLNILTNIALYKKIPFTFQSQDIYENEKMKQNMSKNFNFALTHEFVRF